MNSNLIDLAGLPSLEELPRFAVFDRQVNTAAATGSVAARANYSIRLITLTKLDPAPKFESIEKLRLSDRMVCILF